MRTLPPTLLCLGTVLATVCIGSGCSGAKDDLAEEGSLSATATASRLRVRRGDFRERILLTGELEAVDAALITTPRTPTWQVQIRWMEEDGAIVTTGQKILELDNSAFTVDLEEKRLAVSKEEKELQQQKAQAEAEASEKAFAVEQRRVELEKARIQADIPEDLLPQREFQERQLAREKAEIAFEKAEEALGTHRRTSAADQEIRRVALEKSRYEIRLAEQAIGALTLVAPRDGVVIIGTNRREARKLQEGDTVWPGVTLMGIPNLDQMQVRAQLSDVDDGLLRIGMEAVVELDSYPDLSFPGRISDITPVAQEMSPRSLRRAFQVRIELDRTDPERMRPGMAARVEVSARELADVLLVARSAVDFESSPPRALLKGGEWIYLKLGPCNSLECVVEDGMQADWELQSVSFQGKES